VAGFIKTLEISVPVVSPLDETEIGADDNCPNYILLCHL
jgi:hypothetical protein